MINVKESLISCSKCKGRVPLNDLRADKTGAGWVCISCYSLQHPNLNIKKPIQQNIQAQNIKKAQPKNQIMNDILKKYNYQCNGCKYRFSRNFEYKGVCPFCGKFNTLEDLNMDLEI